MFYMTDYKDDALKITDEQVAADWRMGLLRGVARVVRRSAIPNDSTGPYGSAVPGSNRAHLLGGNMEKYCSLVEIYEVREENGERYNFSTFGDSTNDVILLKAKATCACGRLVKHPVEMVVSPGELISQVTNAE